MIKSKGKILLICLLLGLTVGNFAFAALVNCGQNSTLPPQPGPNATQQEITNYQAAVAANQCKITDLIFTIERIINFLLSWAWIVAIFYIMWAGFNMINARGNSEEIVTAKAQLSHAIIGFVLIMVAYLLINWVVSIFTGGGDPRAGSFNVIRNLLPKP